MAAFKPGENVKLKPCGPVMKVERQSGENTYFCVWQNRDGKTIGNDFAVDLLAPADPADPADCTCGLKGWLRRWF